MDKEFSQKKEEAKNPARAVFQSVAKGFAIWLNHPTDKKLARKIKFNKGLFFTDDKEMIEFLEKQTHVCTRLPDEKPRVKKLVPEVPVTEAKLQAKIDKLEAMLEKLNDRITSVKSENVRLHEEVKPAPEAIIPAPVEPEKKPKGK